MAAESVQIILEGVDQASPAFSSVSRKMDQTAATSKKLAGIFSQIFGSVGLDSLANFTDEFSRLSGQMKELGEAGKKGGAGMLVAKAGIVAAVVAASFKVGTMIADWIYKTEEWNLKMQQTLSNISKQSSFANTKTQQQFDMQMQLAEAALTEEQRLAELENIRAKKNKEVEEAKRRLAQERADLEEAIANDTFGYGQEDNEISKEGVRIAEERLELLQQQQREVGKAISGPTAKEEELAQRLAVKKAEEEILSIQKEVDSLRDPAAAEREAILAKAVTDEQRAQLELILQKKEAIIAEAAGAEAIKKLQQEIAELQNPEQAERDLILAQAANDEQRKELELLIAQKEAVKERQKAEQEAADEYQRRMDDLQASMAEQAQRDEEYLNNLKARNLELTKGKEAADEFRALQAGVSETAIEEGRALVEQNKAIEERLKMEEEKKKEEEKGKKELNKTPDSEVQRLQAMESRLLSRAPGGGGDRIAKATEKTAEAASQTAVMQKEMLTMQKRWSIKELAVIKE